MDNVQKKYGYNKYCAPFSVLPADEILYLIGGKCVFLLSKVKPLLLL
jgi:hypothetical protein